MADVFISYSRKDIQFAQRIHQELEARDREPWVDWQDIPPTSEWLDEVYAGIQEADTFLFIISPDSVVSEICTLEIEHAIQHNKRLVPVVWHDVEDDQVHSAMSARNWIFLRQEDDFEAGLELLIGALDTDLVYIREHTRLLTRAIEWHDNDKRRSDVLRGPDLTAAEGWLAISHSMEPRSTDLHGDYIAFSRATVNRLQRLIYSAITVAFAIVLGLAFFAFQQRNQAVDAKNVAEARRQEAELAKAEEEKQRKFAEEQKQQAVTAKEEKERQRQLAEEAADIAEARRQEADIQRQLAEKTTRISKSQALAAFALMEVDKDTELSILLSTESAKTTYQADGIVLPLSKTVLRQSILRSRIRLTLRGHGDGSVFSVAWSPDGQSILTGSDDMTAKVWDAQTGQELLTLQGHAHVINTLAWSPDGQRIVTGSADEIAKVWDAETGQVLSTLTGHDDYVNSVACSPDGQSILTGSDDMTAKVWDAQTGQELLTLQGHDGSVFSVAWSPDGQRIVTGSRDQTAKVWDTEIGQELFNLIGHTHDVNSVAWSLDGKQLLTGSEDQTAKVWDAQTGKELFTLTGHSEGVNSVAWSSDGQHIVTGSADETAKVWDAQTGKELFTLTGHDDKVFSIACSPDGQRIVTGSVNNIAKAWDAQTGQELMTLTGHDHWVSSVSWMPEGKRIATGGKYGLVQVYTTDIDELIQIAESRVTRQLTAEEKEKYGVLGLN